MVETAIVMPLYVFLILGMLQLGLMHQARLMTKYAAYKAVRAGSLHNASVAAMETAALAVLLPMVSQPASGGAELILPTNGASAYGDKWDQMKNSDGNLMPDAALPYAEVTICGPIQQDLSGNSGEVDFDDPSVAASDDWRTSEATKLRIQVTFNYRMAIPFANMVIHRASRDQELPYVLRMMNDPDSPGFVPVAARLDQYTSIAESQKLYILPIRATYTMRMQSNIFINAAPIPSANLCVFPFHY